jgi:hypothetical protein
MSKHTPGPWAYALEYGPNITEPPCITTVARCANYVIGLPSDCPGGNYRDGDPSGDEEADARLIASAPELLDALQKLEQVLREAGEEDGGNFDWEAINRDEGAKARDAIRSATGKLFNTEVDRPRSGRTQS